MRRSTRRLRPIGRSLASNKTWKTTMEALYATL
nr:MAG TPA: hypothetical protein [Caudoviricetes sp.]